MPEETSNCARIFISYAHEDQEWLVRVAKHLGGLRHQGLIAPFDDRAIPIGARWDETIKRKLDESDLIIFLVSADFLDSCYIHKVEVERALKRHDEGKAWVMPIIIKRCHYKSMPFAEAQVFPRPGPKGIIPVSRWKDPDDPLTDITDELWKWAKEFAETAAAKAKEAAAPPPDAIDLARYAERARLKYEAIDLSALAAPGADDPDARPKLHQVFIPQDARKSRPAVSLPRDYLLSQGLDPDAEERRQDELLRRWQAAERAPALDLLAHDDARRTVVLGDPGAGKSALARFVLLRLLELPSADDNDARHAWRAKLDGHMPFLIELRDYIAREAEGKCANLLGYLAYLGEEQGFGFNRERLERHLATKPSLIIFDGLDEIFDPNLRRRIAEEIIGLAVRCPYVRVLVTSRIAGFDAHPFEAAGFMFLALDDLDEDQITTFAENWFALAFPGQPDQAERSTKDLLDTLGQRPQLNSIAGNPLLLTIMGIVARHRPLARSRAALYAQALGVLCHNWDYKRGLGLPADSPLRDLTPDDTLDLLRRIAWRMQEAGEGLKANVIAEVDLRATIEGYFEEPWHFDLGKRRRAAAEMLEQLQKRHWILTLRGPVLYGFVHRTFLEYLCASELIRRFHNHDIEFDDLWSHYILARVNDDSWREVIRLLVAQLPARHAADVIAAFLPEPKLERVHKHQSRLVLAFQCLAEQETQKFRQFADVAGWGLDVFYVWLELQGCYGAAEIKIAEQITAALTTLSSAEWPARNLAERGLPSIANLSCFEASKMLVALARSAWRNEDNVRSLLVHEATGTRAKLVSKAAAIIAICELYKDTCAKALAQQCAVGSESWLVRSAALWALAQHFRDAVEVRPLLLRYAAEDPDAGGRAGAILAWAWAYREKLERVLVSRDLDGFHSSIDPREPITLARVETAATKLGKSTDEIKAAYEKLAEELPLKLEWRMPPHG